MFLFGKCYVLLKSEIENQSNKELPINASGPLDVITMKKNILLIALLCVSSLLSAQPYRLKDTIVVFKLKFETPNGTVLKYVPYKIPRKLRWTDKQNAMHRAVLRKINAHYLLLDTTRVYPSDISALVMTHFPDSCHYTHRKTKPVIYDSSGRFTIMSYYDFRNLIKIISFSENAQHIPNPFFKNISSEKYAADLERKRLRRIEHFAALDTCPLRYGLKTNLVRDLLNEINLSVEIPLKRNFCIDVGVGILYTRPYTESASYDMAFAQFSFLKSSNQSWFDHSYYNRKGFGIEVIPKFFISKKKNLYIGPQLCFRYYNYHNKWIFINDEPGDYYYRANYAYQSEKSTAVHLNIMFGVQTPPIKRFLFDAFISFGFMYRGGTVSRSIEKTTGINYGTYLVNYDPPQAFKGGGFSLSGQIGLRLGLRFGKTKLYK